MDSSHQEKAPQKESSSSDQEKAPQKESSSSNTDSSSPPPPAAAVAPAPPHMMYYPPGPGYPGHGPPPAQLYHPYPPQPGYAPYPNEYPNGYNNYNPGAPSYYGPPQTYRASDGGRGFVRGFIMCSCVLFTVFFVTTLVMALMVHPKLPIYKVNSLSVTNFNTTPTFTGEWNISVTVQNPNERLRGYFNEFKVDVVFEQDAVAMAYVPDFEMEKREEKQMDVKASSNGVSFQKWDLDKFSNQRVDGSVTVGVKISSLTAFKSTSLSTRSAMILAICEGLKVVFQNNTGNGTWDNGGKPIYCQLFM